MQLSEIRQLVLDRLAASSMDTLFDPAVVDRAINAANRRFGREMDWPWLLAVDTAVAVAANANTVDLSAVTRYRHTKLLANGPRILAYRTPLEFQTWNERTDSEPQIYTIIGDTLYLAPIPTSAQTLTHVYIVDEPALEGDTGEPLLPDAYTEVLVLAACKTMAMRMGDTSKYGMFRQEYETAVKEARDEVRRTRQLPVIAAEHTLWITV